MKRIVSYVIFCLSLCMLILTVMAYTLSGPEFYNFLSGNITFIVIAFYFITIIGYYVIVYFSEFHNKEKQRYIKLFFIGILLLILTNVFTFWRRNYYSTIDESFLVFHMSLLLELLFFLFYSGFILLCQFKVVKAN